jgi:hypothetical protein
LNPFQNILRTTRKNDPKIIYYKTLNSLTPLEIRRNYKVIFANPVFKKFSLTTKKGFHQFYKEKLNNKLEVVLAWSESIIINSQSKINKFIQFEKNITKEILCENYDNALEIIQEVEEVFGKSMWALQIKSYLLYKCKTHDEQKEFISSDVNKANAGVTNFIMNDIGSRVDKDDIYFTSTNEFNKKLEEAFSHDLSFLYFLKYKLL